MHTIRSNKEPKSELLEKVKLTRKAERFRLLKKRVSNTPISQIFPLLDQFLTLNHRPLSVIEQKEGSLIGIPRVK